MSTITRLPLPDLLDVEVEWEYSGLGSFRVRVVEEAMSHLGCPALAEIYDFWTWVRSLDSCESYEVIAVLRSY